MTKYKYNLQAEVLSGLDNRTMTRADGEEVSNDGIRENIDSVIDTTQENITFDYLPTNGGIQII